MPKPKKSSSSKVRKQTSQLLAHSKALIKLVSELGKQGKSVTLPPRSK